MWFILYVHMLHQTDANCQTTTPVDLGCESACRLLLSTSTYAVTIYYYYYLAHKLIVINFY